MRRNSKESIDAGCFSGGFVRDRGGGQGVRVSRAKKEDMPVLDAKEVEARAALEKINNPNVGPGSPPTASSPLRVRRTKLAVMGLSKEVLDRGDPRYASCVRLANSFRKARMSEMYIAHGYVSTGVAALLASSALALAGARYLYELASVTEDGRASMLKTASGLSDSSRQNELSAWELCAREAVVRKRNDQNNVVSPWLTEGSDGETKRKPGRPRKAHLVLETKENTNGGNHTAEDETEGSGDPGPEDGGPGYG